jgi:hypothetical protein
VRNWRSTRARLGPPENRRVSLRKAIAARIDARNEMSSPKQQVGYVENFLAAQLAACRGGPMTANLEGVRLRRWPARLMTKSLAAQSLVSYQVIEAPPDHPPVDGRTKEKRSGARRRLRLRSAKLLDSQSAFICECLVRDQSAQGLCLQLMRNIGLPARCVLYDDETGALNVVTTIWRRGALLGVRYCPNATPVSIKASDRAALRGRYYAVPD